MRQGRRVDDVCPSFPRNLVLYPPECLQHPAVVDQLLGQKRRRGGSTFLVRGETGVKLTVTVTVTVTKGG